VSQYRIEAEPAVDADIEAAFEWYEAEEPDLGFEFLGELRAVYQRILEGPRKYQALRSGIRRALTRRFPYAIYFSIEGEVIVVVAVLHTARDPAEWQRRIQ
jgi:plasmid stabilization system protein ParE